MSFCEFAQFGQKFTQKWYYLSLTQIKSSEIVNFIEKSDLSNFIYFKNNRSGSNLRNNPNRRSDGGGSYNGGSGGSYNGGSGGSYNGGSYNGYRRRKVEPEDTGYGIVSAASEAYKVISKYTVVSISLAIDTFDIIKFDDSSCTVARIYRNS